MTISKADKLMREVKSELSAGGAFISIELISGNERIKLFGAFNKNGSAHRAVRNAMECMLDSGVAKSR